MVKKISLITLLLLSQGNLTNCNSSAPIDFEEYFNPDTEIISPKLEYHEPSAVTVWFREQGISFLYKYYNFKAWLSKKMGF